MSEDIKEPPDGRRLISNIVERLTTELNKRKGLHVDEPDYSNEDPYWLGKEIREVFYQIIVDEFQAEEATIAFPSRLISEERLAEQREHIAQLVEAFKYTRSVSQAQDAHNATCDVIAREIRECRY